MKDLLTENFNTLKEIDEGTNKVKIFHVYKLEQLIFLNVYTTQSNNQIQGNLYKNFNGIFNRNRTNYLEICMQKTLNSQSNLEEEKEN